MADALELQATRTLPLVFCGITKGEMQGLFVNLAPKVIRFVFFVVLDFLPLWWR